MHLPQGLVNFKCLFDFAGDGFNFVVLVVDASDDLSYEVVKRRVFFRMFGVVDGFGLGGENVCYGFVKCWRGEVLEGFVVEVDDGVVAAYAGTVGAVLMIGDEEVWCFAFGTFDDSAGAGYRHHFISFPHAAHFHMIE